MLYSLNTISKITATVSNVKAFRSALPLQGLMCYCDRDLHFFIKNWKMKLQSQIVWWNLLFCPQNRKTFAIIAVSFKNTWGVGLRGTWLWRILPGQTGVVDVATSLTTLTVLLVRNIVLSLDFIIFSLHLVYFCFSSSIYKVSVLTISFYRVASTMNLRFHE